MVLVILFRSACIFKSYCEITKHLVEHMVSNLQPQRRILFSLHFTDKGFCSQFHSHGRCDPSAALPHDTHRRVEGVLMETALRDLILPPHVFCVTIHVLFENRKACAHIHTHEKSLQEGLWIEEEMHRTSHSLAYSVSELAVALVGVIFFAMTSHVWI